MDKLIKNVAGNSICSILRKSWCWKNYKNK